jgi:hypothetical protein
VCFFFPVAVHRRLSYDGPQRSRQVSSQFLCVWLSRVVLMNLYSPFRFFFELGKNMTVGATLLLFGSQTKKSPFVFYLLPKRDLFSTRPVFSSSIFIDMSPPPHLKLWLLYIRSGLSPYFFLFTAGRAGCEYLCCHGDPLCKSYTPQPRFGPKKKES